MTPANKGKKYHPEVLDDSEVRALINACSSRCPSGIRNRALIGTLYRGGLRCAEALFLRPKDVNTDKGTVRVLKGKGRKSRTIALDIGSMALILRWMDVRSEIQVNGNSRLFSTLRGKPLASSYVRALFKRLGQKAGIEKRTNPHQLRHTLAAQLAMEGKPMHMIQRILGHSSLQTTDRYVSHLAPREIIEAMRSREWSL